MRIIIGGSITSSLSSGNTFVKRVLNNKLNNTNISGVEKNTSISSFSQMLSEA